MSDITKFKITGSHKGTLIQITHPDKAGMYHVFINSQLRASADSISTALEIVVQYLRNLN